MGALAVTFLALAVLAVDLPLLHDHDRPGLYDQDCLLAHLAGPAPGAPQSPAAPAPRPLPTAEAMLAPAPVDHQSVRAASAGPRAPPVLA